MTSSANPGPGVRLKTGSNQRTRFQNDSRNKTSTPREIR